MNPTYEELKGVQKEVCDLCRSNQKSCDSNTELCIEFWEQKHFDYAVCADDKEFSWIIRKYPPESLVKYRRNLISWGLITPSKASREHSEKMEASNHMPDYLHQFKNHTNQIRIIN